MKLNFKSINEANILGNVTQDPDVRYSNSGSTIMTFNVATNHSQKNAEGKYEDIPTYHRIVVFGDMADWNKDYIKKGTKLHIQGRINNRSYEKDGEKKYISEIIAENIINLSPREKSSSGPTEADLNDAGNEIPY